MSPVEFFLLSFFPFYNEIFMRTKTIVCLKRGHTVSFQKEFNNNTEYKNHRDKNCKPLLSTFGCICGQISCLPIWIPLEKLLILCWRYDITSHFLLILSGVSESGSLFISSFLFLLPFIEHQASSFWVSSSSEDFFVNILLPHIWV